MLYLNISWIFVEEMSINMTIDIEHIECISKISCMPSFGVLMYCWWRSSQARIDISQIATRGKLGVSTQFPRDFVPSATRTTSAT